MFITLNLAYPEKSAIEFEKRQYPDGQQDLILGPDIIDKLVSYKSWIKVHQKNVKILSRLNSFKDLEIIILANRTLRSMGASSVFLEVPYFMGARSDRKFVGGSVNYLKEVICPIINSQNFDQVIVTDPHSDVLEACLNNYSKNSNINLVKWALPQIDNTNDAREKVWLVSPDAGAYKKIFDVAKHFDIRNVVTATKVRDIVTGNINSTEISIDQEPEKRKFVIVDDICDGGRTFIELAKAIREKRNRSMFGDEIYLIVTHGIFSKGFAELSKHFDKIFCTNSFSDVYDTWFDGYKDHPTKVKQLNIF